MKILVTGATGNVGCELVKALARRGASFRAMVRKVEHAGALAAVPGAELVAGDFDDAASLERALHGVDRAFLLTSSSERAEAQQLAFVAAAKRAGVRHVVKLSQWAASPASPVRFLRYHAAVEEALRGSGLAYTFLRPNLFMQGLLGFRQTITGSGRFFASAGDAPVSAVDVRDVAEAAGAALVEPGHENAVYDLTGPSALSHAEIAAELSRATGRPVTYVDVPDAALRQALVEHGFPEWQADGLVEDYAHYRRGEAAAVARGVLDATGRAPRSFAEFARDHALAFGAVASGDALAR